MNLYEITSALESCLIIDPETGEVTEMDEDALNRLCAERGHKVESLACWIKDMDGDITKMKAEESRLKERRQLLERKRESVHAYLSNFLDGEKFSSARCAIGWRKSEQVAIVNEAAVVQWAYEQPDPEIYLITQPAKISKAALKATIKAGEDVPGAAVVSVNNMTLK